MGKAVSDGSKRREYANGGFPYVHAHAQEGNVLRQRQEASSASVSFRLEPSLNARLAEPGVAAAAAAAAAVMRARAAEARGEAPGVGVAGWLGGESVLGAGSDGMVVGLVRLRNSERTAATFLRALAPFVDQVVVLDDASEDGEADLSIVFS